MKAITLLYALLTLPLAAGAQGTFELSGRIDGKNDGIVYLNYMKTWLGTVIDSATLVNGAFFFRGEVDGATSASLYLDRDLKDSNNPNFASLWIEEGKMTITLTAGNFKEYRLTGSRTNDENKELEALNAAPMKELQALSDRYLAETDPGKKNAIRGQMAPFREQLEKNKERFTREHPDSHLSAFNLLLKASTFSPEEGQERLNTLSDRVKQGVMGKALAREVENLQAGLPGTPAALFHVDADIHGDPFDLASLVGKKYVLLDFWASWCVPCRQGNPHLKELYQKYKDDLTVVCISDDDSAPDKWRAAVEQDGLHDFHHVLRGLKRIPGGGFNRSGDIDELYGIHALPTKILIDKSGTIIARYGSNGAALDARLKEIFGR